MREAVGAVVTAGVLLGLTACGGHGSSGASSAPRTSAPTSPSSTPTLTAPHYKTVHVDARTRRASQATTRAYTAGSMLVLASPGGPLPHQDTVTGPALASLLAMRREYAAKHYRVVGRPKVVSEKVIGRRAHPPRLVVAACLDNSAVKVVDKHGTPVTTSPGPTRVMNLLTLVLRDGHWVVTRSTLPTNPTC